MIYALRFPYWMFHALKIAPSVWSAAVAIERGIVVQAGKRAQLAGVKPGMEADKARSLFPDSHVVERNRVLEMAWAERMTLFLYGLTPQVEPQEAGCWFVESCITLKQAFFQHPEAAYACAGASEDKPLALLASAKAGEGHCLVVERSRKHAFLEGSHVSLLHALGVGAESIQMLEWTGFETLKRVTSLTRRQLQLQFGEDAMRLMRLLYPDKQDTQVAWFRPKPEIVHTQEISWSELTADYVRELSILGAESVIRQLDGKGFHVLELQILSPEGELYQKVLKEPVFLERRLIRLLEKALPVVLPQKADEHQIRVRARVIRPNEGPSGDLFARPGLEHAIHRANRRFPGRIFSFRGVPDALFPEHAFRAVPRLSKT